MSNQKFRTNAIGHFDVSGPDIEQLGNFYSAVFGWQVDLKGSGYAMLKTPDGLLAEPLSRPPSSIRPHP